MQNTGVAPPMGEPEEIGIDIGTEDGQVILQFPMPIITLKFGGEGARAIAAELIAAADELDNQPPGVTH